MVFPIIPVVCGMTAQARLGSVWGKLRRPFTAHGGNVLAFIRLSVLSFLIAGGGVFPSPLQAAPENAGKPEPRAGLERTGLERTPTDRLSLEALIRKLGEAEAALDALRDSSAEPMPGPERDALSKAKVEQVEYAAKAKVIRDAAAQGRLFETSEIIHDPIVSRLLSERASIQSKIAYEGQTYLPQHPRMQALAAALKTSEAQIQLAAERAARAFDNEARAAIHRYNTLLADANKRAPKAGGNAASAANPVDRDVLKAEVTRLRAQLLAISAPPDAARNAYPTQANGKNTAAPALNAPEAQARRLPEGSKGAPDVLGSIQPNAKPLDFRTPDAADARNWDLPLDPHAWLPKPSVAFFLGLGIFILLLMVTKRLFRGINSASSSSAALADALAQPKIPLPESGEAAPNWIQAIAASGGVPARPMGGQPPNGMPVPPGMVPPGMGPQGGMPPQAMQQQQMQQAMPQQQMQQAIPQQQMPQQMPPQAPALPFSLTPIDTLAAASTRLATLDGHRVIVVGSTSDPHFNNHIVMPFARKQAERGSCLVVTMDRPGPLLEMEAPASADEKHSLGHYLRGQARLSDILGKDPGSNTYFIPSGGNLRVLLRMRGGQARFEALLDAVAAQFDTVVIDQGRFGVTQSDIREAGDASGLTVFGREIDEMLRTRAHMYGVIVHMPREDAFANLNAVQAYLAQTHPCPVVPVVGVDLGRVSEKA